MQTRVHWGLEGHRKAGNTGTTPSFYIRVSTWEIARSKFDVIKISNVKVFVDIIFVRRGINHTKYTKICTNPKFPTMQYMPLIFG